MGKAEEILRVKLGNKASKAASRIAAEGVVAVYIAPDGKNGALVEVNCETDFVAKNGEFLAFCRQRWPNSRRMQRPADVEALSRLPLNGTDRGRVAQGAGRQDRREHGDTPLRAHDGTGALASYVHGGAKIGVLVDVAGGDDALGKDLAMHIAASKPVALSVAAVPAELVQKERAIAAAKAAESGKPANIVEKMVEGCGPEIPQGSHAARTAVRQERQADRRAAAEVERRVGGRLSPSTWSARASRRKKDDFAAEVMAQVGQAG